jgi:SEC-C motif
MEFKDRIEPLLTTDDPIILDFVTNTLHDYPNVSEEWIKKLIGGAAQNEEKISSILTFLRVNPMHEEVAEMIAQGVNHASKGTRNLYRHLVYELVPDMALKHRNEISLNLSKDDWELYEVLVNGSEKDVRKIYSDILNKLEDEVTYNSTLYRQAKKVAYTLVKNGWVTEDEIERDLEENLKQEWFNYNGILVVYMIGLMKMDTYIHKLVPLLVSDEDILLEEVAATLISLQSDEVIEAVAPYLLKEESNIFAASIVENIKTDYAVEVLRNAYHQVHDDDSRAIIIEALIHHLSPVAEPEINEYVSGRPSSFFVEIEQLAYSYYKIMGFDHPLLNEWIDTIQNRGNEGHKAENIPNQPIRVEKVGRNDPCLCGSGKKYKKCCG